MNDNYSFSNSLLTEKDKSEGNGNGAECPNITHIIPERKVDDELVAGVLINGVFVRIQEQTARTDELEEYPPDIFYKGRIMLTEGKYIPTIHEDLWRPNQKYKAYIDKIREKYSKYILKKGARRLTLDEMLIANQIYSPDYQYATQFPATEYLMRLQQRKEITDRFDYDAMREAYFSKREELRALKVQEKKHASHLLGPREFTLTYSPKWFDDETAQYEMTRAIQRLVKYYDEEIELLRAVGERGTNGLSHVHCFYSLKNGKKITDKNFVRAYPRWNVKKITSRSGHEGGHHANVKNISDFLGYIDKDINDAWLDTNIDNRNKETDPQPV